jgi:hypothetical protein
MTLAQGLPDEMADTYLVCLSDILVRRMQYHGRQAWTLRSYLQRVDDTAKAA